MKNILRAVIKLSFVTVAVLLQADAARDTETGATEQFPTSLNQHFVPVAPNPNPLLSLSLCLRLPPGLPSPDLGAAWTFPAGPVSAASTRLRYCSFYARFPLLYNFYMYFLYLIWCGCICSLSLPLVTLSVLSLSPACPLPSDSQQECSSL